MTVYSWTTVWPRSQRGEESAKACCMFFLLILSRTVLRLPRGQPGTHRRGMVSLTQAAGWFFFKKTLSVVLSMQNQQWSFLPSEFVYWDGIPSALDVGVWADKVLFLLLEIILLIAQPPEGGLPPKERILVLSKVFFSLRRAAKTSLCEMLRHFLKNRNCANGAAKTEQKLQSSQFSALYSARTDR